MWYLGEDKWMLYGWGKTLSANYNNNNLYIKIKKDIPEQNLPLSLSAAVEVIKKITSTYPGPYTLMCSGGVDSQAMLWAWQQSGKPFEAVAVKYISNDIFFNDYDLAELNTFATTYKIPINYQNLDVISFLNGPLNEVSTAYDCASPQICTHIYMTKFIVEGTVIFAGNFGSERFKPALSYHQLGLHRYAMSMESDTSKKIIPFFFLHNQELANSFVLSKWDNWMNEYDLKCQIYQMNGYPVIPQNKKFNGFEKLKEYYDLFENQVPKKTRLSYSDMRSFRVFDLLYRYPLGINKSIHKQQTVVITE